MRALWRNRFHCQAHPASLSPAGIQQQGAGVSGGVGLTLDAMWHTVPFMTPKNRDRHRGSPLVHWADPRVVKALRKHARRRRVALAVLLRMGDADLLKKLDKQPLQEARDE